MFFYGKVYLDLLAKTKTRVYENSQNLDYGVKIKYSKGSWPQWGNETFIQLDVDLQRSEKIKIVEFV